MRLASKTECTACMACVDVCPKHILLAEMDADGYFAIRCKDESSCIECGRCAHICPILNPQKVSSGISKPFAAWNTDTNQRTRSASGGVFAALAIAILRKNGSVYGAAIDGFSVKHRRITEVHELTFLQGSKYQHSDLTGIYRQVREDVRNGMYVLFSGLGCQVTGLLSYLGNVDISRLYTVDTVCGGLSTFLPMKSLKETGRYKGILSFRDKDNGWRSTGFRYSLKMEREDGTIEDLGLDNTVLNSFSSKLLKRSSCLDCKFTGIHRSCDCTIGDFWGDQRFIEQHTRGLSVLLVHDNRIMNLINEATIETRPCTWKEAVAHNPNIYWTHYPQIRYFKSRKKALETMKCGNYTIAMKQMFPWSFSGLYLRIYLKINNLWKNVMLPYKFKHM